MRKQKRLLIVVASIFELVMFAGRAGEQTDLVTAGHAQMATGIDGNFRDKYMWTIFSNTNKSKEVQK